MLRVFLEQAVDQDVRVRAAAHDDEYVALGGGRRQNRLAIRSDADEVDRSQRARAVDRQVRQRRRQVARARDRPTRPVENRVRKLPRGIGIHVLPIFRQPHFDAAVGTDVQRSQQFAGLRLQGPAADIFDDVAHLIAVHDQRRGEAEGEYHKHAAKQAESQTMRAAQRDSPRSNDSQCPIWFRSATRHARRRACGAGAKRRPRARSRCPSPPMHKGGLPGGPW